MSYLLKTVRIDMKTNQSTLISEKVVEGDYRNGQEDLFVKLLAEDCLKAIQEERSKDA